jgi:pimeloyl-ACP methyl ester carboxylesterase
VLTTPAGWTEEDGLSRSSIAAWRAASRDILGFDWWAQAYASQGYMVLQPNFRGSVGYGVEFRTPGMGSSATGWSLTVWTAARALLAAGLARGETFCVAGASYGGYAALRAAILAPEDVACVVACCAGYRSSDLLGMRVRSGGGVFVYDFLGTIYRRSCILIVTPPSGYRSFAMPRRYRRRFC